MLAILLVEGLRNLISYLFLISSPLSLSLIPALPPTPFPVHSLGDIQGRGKN